MKILEMEALIQKKRSEVSIKQLNMKCKKILVIEYGTDS